MELRHEQEIDNFFRENEKNNNLQNGKILLICGLVCLLSWSFYLVGIWESENFFLTTCIYLPIVVMCLFVSGICHTKKGERKWMKWMIIIVFFLCALLVGLMSSSLSAVVIVYPIVVSCVYYEPFFAVVTSFFSVLSLILMSFLKIFVKPLIMKDIDVRFICLPKNTKITFNGSQLYRTLIHYDFDKMLYLKTEIMYELLPVLLFLIIVSITCIHFSVRGKNNIIRRRQETLKRAALEVELNENKTRTMVSQIKPHFIFNVLNSIYELCEEDPKMAQHAIDDFSSYLRVNVDTLSYKQNIPFQKELDHIRTYVDLEQLRFGDRVNVIYDIQADQFMIPPLSIQPLMENAIKHGICKKLKGGTVTLSSLERDGYIYIVIEDDGVGFDPDSVPNDGRPHVGLNNTKERLKLLCNADIIVESRLGEGTKVTIQIPKGEVV